jgi:N-acylglucosamine 2-epimerase
VLEDVLPFWRRHSVDRRHGGFNTCLTRTGEVYDTAKSSAMQSRMTYAFAIGHELDPGAGHLELARHGVDFLLGPGLDRESDGWCDTTNADGSVLEDTKRLFTEAYVLFGLTHYARVAGDGALLERVLGWYELLERQAWDVVHGGYYAKCNRDWSTFTDAKSICVQLDFMKLVHLLHDITGEQRFLDRMAELADLVALRMREPRNGAVLELYSRDWIYYPFFTSDRIELGHNLKAVRMLLETHALTGDGRHLDAARETLRFALAHGWDDRHGGFYQDLFRSGRLASTEKEWWSHCEGLWALLLMHRETGDLDLEAYAQRLMDFCFTRCADPEHGEWYMSCHPDGTPANDRKGGLHKAAYHVVDACMAPVTLLAVQGERAARATA